MFNWINATDQKELHRYQVRIYKELSKSPTIEVELEIEPIWEQLLKQQVLFKKKTPNPKKHWFDKLAET